MLISLAKQIPCRLSRRATERDRSTLSPYVGVGTTLALMVVAAPWSTTGESGLLAAWMVAIVLSLPILISLSKKAPASYLPLLLLLYWPLRMMLAYFLTPLVVFGDEKPLLLIGQSACSYWTQHGFGLIPPHLTATSGGKYSLLLYYFGIPQYLFGQGAGVIEPFQILVQIIGAYEAFELGRRLFGPQFGRASAVFFLLYPDYILNTSAPARDVPLTVACIMYMRSLLAIHDGRAITALCRIIPALIGVAGLRFTYGAVLALHACAVTLLSRRLSRSVGTVVVLLGICVLSYFSYDLYAQSAGSRPGVEGLTDSVSHQMHSQWTQTSSASGGTIGSAKTSSFLLISLPVRIAVAVFAPFPWTSLQIFEAAYGGFNGSFAILALRIANCMVTVFVLTAFFMALLIDNLRNSLLFTRWSGAALLGLLLLVGGGFAAVGFLRYLFPALPFLLLPAWAMLSGRVERLYLSSTAAISIASPIIVHLLYFALKA